MNSTGPEISITGLPTAEAKKKITAWLEEKNLGKKTINYKLRDWLFSRQRYWGEPFPIVWKKDAAGKLSSTKRCRKVRCPFCRRHWKIISPPPTASRRSRARKIGCIDLSRLAAIARNEHRCRNGPARAGIICATPMRRMRSRSSARTRTIIGWHPNGKAAGVDLYVGGTEHAVLHLLYARFWHKVLFDLGHVSTPEPFYKLVNQGLILGEDGQKMSKSRGNVVNPDDVLVEYGADAFRLYEMFMGPLQDTKPWNTKGVEGVYRFLGRAWRLFVDEKSETAYEQAETTKAQSHEELLDLILLDGAIAEMDATPAQLKTLHACIKKVSEDLDGMRFNTAISAMMVFINEAMTWQTKPLSVMKTFLQLLAPFAPHIAEELWARLAFHVRPNRAFATLRRVAEV